jgi:hypothetical protein
MNFTVVNCCNSQYNINQKYNPGTLSIMALHNATQHNNILLDNDIEMKLHSNAQNGALIQLAMPYLSK